MNPVDRSPAVTVILVVLSVVLVVSWLWLMVWVMPAYEKTFNDFRMKLPAHTETTIAVSRYGVNYWYALLFVTVPFSVIGYFLRHYARSGLFGLIWFGLMIGLPLVGQALMWASVLTAHADLLRGLQGAK